MKFPGDATVQRDAAVLVAGVPYGPGLATVEMALRDFAIRHFADGNTNADIPRPTRHTTPRGWRTWNSFSHSDRAKSASSGNIMETAGSRFPAGNNVEASARHQPIITMIAARVRPATDADDLYGKTTDGSSRHLVGGAGQRGRGWD